MRMNLANVGHNFVIYDGINLADHFIVRSIEMPLLPEIDASTLRIDGKAGEWFSKRQIGTRDVVIGLGVLNDTKDRKEILDTWWQLSELISKDKECKLELGTGRYVNAILVGDTDIKTNGKWSTVEVTFRCFDPYVYGDTHTETLKAGNNTIYVKGKCQTYPVISLTGASTTTLTDTLTGDKVRVESLTSSQTLVINMAEYRCTVNGNYKAADISVTDFWPLRPGENTLNVSSGSGSLTYQEVYL